MKSITLVLLIQLFCIKISICQVNTVASIKLATDLSKKYPESSVYVEDNSTTVKYSVENEKTGAKLTINAVKI